MAFDRRDFLKFAVGGAIGSLFTPIPWKLADDISIWTQNWPWIPRVPKGELTSKNTVIKLGGSAYGAKVNLVGKNPITISGDPQHPLSLGGVDPVGLNAVSLMYSPSRITTPLKKDANGEFVKISWEEAQNILIEKLKIASKKYNNVLFISGDDTSSINEIFSSIVKSLNSSLYFYEPSDRQKYFYIWNDLLNGSGDIGFDIENSDYLLVLGCDLLDNWGTYVRNQRIFGKNNIKIDYVGPYLNHTSVVSNNSLLISEKDIYKFLFATTNIILNSLSTVPAIYGIDEFLGFVTFNYNPEKIAKEIGCSLSDIKSFAKNLINSKRPLIIVGSTLDGSGPNKNIIAGLLLNILLNRINTKGGITCIPNPPQIVKNSLSHHEILKKDLLKDLTKIHSKNIKLAIFYETNPFYDLPKSFRDKLEKIEFKVSISPIMNESCLSSDLIIPSPYFLERLDDTFTPFGSAAANYSVNDKIVSKKISYYVPEFFIDIAKKLKINIGINSFDQVIKAKAEYFGMKFDALLNGECWRDYTFETQYNLTSWNKKLEQIFSKYESSVKDEELEIIPIVKRKTGTSITGILPYSSTVIYEDEIPSKYVYANIHPETCAKYHLKDNDKILIKTSSGEIKAYVKMDNGINLDSIGILYGLGRKIKDKFNEEKGESVVELLELNKEQVLDTFYWSCAKAKIEKI